MLDTRAALMNDALEKMRVNGLIPKIVIMRADLAASPFGQALQANAETVRPSPKLAADVLVPRGATSGPLAFVLVDDELKRPSIDAAFERIEKTARLFPETVVLLVDPPPDALRDLQRALPSIESARADGHDAAASSARALRIQPCSTAAAAAQLCVMTASHGADAARRRKGAEWVEQQYVEKLRAPHAPLDVWLKICAMLRVPESEGRLLLDIHESIAELSVVNFARLARSQKIPIDERTAFVLDALFGPSAETRSLEELGVLDGFPEASGPTENYDGTRQDLGLAGLAPQASPRSTAPPEVRHHLPFRPVAADPSTRARSSDPYLHAPPSPPLPQRMMSSHNEWEPPPPPPPGHARGWRQDPVWAPQEQQFWPGGTTYSLQSPADDDRFVHAGGHGRWPNGDTFEEPAPHEAAWARQPLHWPHHQAPGMQWGGVNDFGGHLGGRPAFSRRR